jgi:hypothetical protein
VVDETYAEVRLKGKELERSSVIGSMIDRSFDGKRLTMRTMRVSPGSLIEK